MKNIERRTIDLGIKLEKTYMEVPQQTLFKKSDQNAITQQISISQTLLQATSLLGWLLDWY